LSDSWFDQPGFRCRLEWGRDGARRAAARGDILVVVDTLRFSTCVATAVHGGAWVYPCAEGEAPETVALQADVDWSPEMKRTALSPMRYLDAQPGDRIVIPSPNGGTCARYGRAAPAVLAGTLVNASATGAYISTLLADSAACVTVVACGERWAEHQDDGPLRFAIEDYLGAGAILDAIPYGRSPEADLCASAFHAVRTRIADVLWSCGSGIELRDRGREDDLRLASHIDLFSTVAIMRGDHFEPL
jgi:2-phosphosulfolactate phosphatase